MANSELRRYVLLEHTMNDGVHFDLMLDIADDEKLRTIQLVTRMHEHDQTCAAKEIDAHRRDYLDYEGSVSNGRGHVRRVERGRFGRDPDTPIRWLTLLPEGAAPYQLHFDSPISVARFHQPPLPPALQAWLKKPS
ncbi:MAG: hypothetical protein IT462_02910 [Planctomycetes bacterium]|nr:hypothetical protein [Planctomycetota bacterium]